MYTIIIYKVSGCEKQWLKFLNKRWKEWKSGISAKS